VPGVLAHDGALWRRLAWLGAAHGPRWWLRYSPPAFGLAAAALVPRARHAVAKNLRRIRGEVSAAREALEVAETFTTYAQCLAEGLASGSKNDEQADIRCTDMGLLRDASAPGKGMILVTAHTAGWELTGPGLARDLGLDILLVVEAEKSAAARSLQDGARRANGLGVVHVGQDPLAPLALVPHLRRGGAVAMQIDRVPRGMRGRRVRLLGGEGVVPEGPLRLAEVTGAPLVPAFSIRLGFRRYIVDVSTAIHLPRRGTEAERDAAAQSIADAMTRLLRAHPTQWLDFGEGGG
jgi:lauroyl/myristoyl acyltransferase